jgi:hypothetical protein
MKTNESKRKKKTAKTERKKTQGKQRLNTCNRPHEGDNYQAQRQTTSKKEKERVNKRNRKSLEGRRR